MIWGHTEHMKKDYLHGIANDRRKHVFCVCHLRLRILLVGWSPSVTNGGCSRAPNTRYRLHWSSVLPSTGFSKCIPWSKDLEVKICGRVAFLVPQHWWDWSTMRNDHWSRISGIKQMDQIPAKLSRSHIEYVEILVPKVTHYCHWFSYKLIDD